MTFSTRALALNVAAAVGTCSMSHAMLVILSAQAGPAPCVPVMPMVDARVIDRTNPLVITMFINRVR